MNKYLNFYKRQSLQNKLLIFTMSMVLFMGGTVGLLIRFIIFPYLVHEMEGRGAIIARRLAESTRTSILTQDRSSLSASLFEEKHIEKNIAYIIVTDREGHLLAHTFLDSLPGYKAQGGLNEAIPPGTLSAAEDPNGHITEIVAPVYEGLYQIGTIRVGLDKQFIEDVTNRLSLFHLGFIGIITMVGLGFGVYLSRAISKPITFLTNLAGEISLGNLNTRISMGERERCWDALQCEKKNCPAYGSEELRCWFVDYTLCGDTSVERFPEKLDHCRLCSVYKAQSGDQIVQLADAFNHMTRRLRDSEAEIRRSEERYRLLFNNDPSPVFVVALDTFTILDANERAAEWYGLAKESFLDMSFTDLGFSGDASQIVNAFMSTLKEGKTCSLIPRIRHLRQFGDPFWVNIYFCHYNHMGRQCLIVTTTDITEIIETETKLIQAGKMATLGEMSAGVSHELNQPLNAIKVGSEFLLAMVNQQAAIPEEDLKEVAGLFSKEVDRASAIINHLREFGRKSYITRQMVDINRPIRGVFTILGQQLKVHGIEVVMDLDETLPPILADENRIEQVMVNLINNARDAMEANREHGAPAMPDMLSVRSFLEDDRVVVTVSDTGHGIPEAIRTRIFEPFFTTKEIGKGTGLGLSISYGIVRDYNGTIGFKSDEGAGTTFKISFPQAPEEQ